MLEGGLESFEGRSLIVRRAAAACTASIRVRIHQGEFALDYQANVTCPDHNGVGTSHRRCWGSGRSYRSSRARFCRSLTGAEPFRSRSPITGPEAQERPPIRTVEIPGKGRRQIHYLYYMG